jgi:hypothetical protein
MRWRGVPTIRGLIARVRIAPSPEGPVARTPAAPPDAPPTRPQLAEHASRFVQLERDVWERCRPQVRDAVQAALDALATAEVTHARPLCCGQPMRRHDCRPVMGELVRLEARRKKLVELVMDGVPGREVKDELIAIGHHRDVLEGQVKAANEPPPLLHPSMADLYRTKVQQLAEALQREDTRTEASETLRGLIDSIVLMPEKGQLRIELRGNLAAMLTAAQKTRRSPETGDLLVPVQLVAGAGFEPATFGL